MKVEKEKIKSFFKIKGFYIVACLCLTAVGIAAYGMFSSAQKNIALNEPSTSSPTYFNQTSSEEKTDSVPKTQSSFVSSAKSTAKSKPKTKTKKTSATVTDTFIIPVHGDILKHFNNKELTYSKTLNDLRLHPALDIACDQGTPVNAAANGTVTEVANDTFSGNVIVIEHSNGFTMRYVGVAPNNNIKKGTKVTKDTVLGLSCEIPYECEDEPHIHIEVLKNNEFVSPEKLLGINE